MIIFIKASLLLMGVLEPKGLCGDEVIRISRGNNNQGVETIEFIDCFSGKVRTGYVGEEQFNGRYTNINDIVNTKLQQELNELFDKAKKRK